LGYAVRIPDLPGETRDEVAKGGISLSEELTLQDVVRVLRKRLIWIVFLMITGAIVAYIFSSYFMTPVYSASTQLIVNTKHNENSFLTYTDLQISLNLIEIYKEILKKP